MDTADKVEKNKSMTKSNFGKMGWFMIVYIGVMLFIAGLLVGDGFNIILPTFAKAGLNIQFMLKVVTLAQTIALIYGFFAIFIIRKIGPRIMSTVSMIIIGVMALIWGHTTTIVPWAICLIIIQCNVQMITANACMTLAQNWFPTKKGLALGWATIGSNVGSATSVYILTFIFRQFHGIGNGLVSIGIAILIFAVITFFVYRDAPEQMGLTPDNIPMTEEELKASREKFEEAEPIRIGKLLKHSNFWVDSILFGLLGMVCAGLVSQLVTGLTQQGIEYSRAVALFAIAGILAMFMSYFYGWLDVKIGTKMATFYLSLSFAVGALCIVLIPKAEFLVYPGVFLIAGGIGGYVNLMPSMCGTIFGRKLFVQAYGVASLITGIIRSTIFTIMAWSLATFGSYVTAYKLMIGIAFVSALMCFLFKEKQFALQDGEEVEIDI